MNLLNVILLFASYFTMSQPQKLAQGFWYNPFMNEVYQALDQAGIGYEKYEHPAVYTVDEAQKYDRGNSAHSKNLFLRNKKGSRHYLVIVEASKKVELKKLELLLEETGLSFASSERMNKYLGLSPGAVSPFGLLNDAHKEVRVIVDADLLKHARQGFHPNVNTATLIISTEDFKRFLSLVSDSVHYLPIPS
jgi:Ala-tRNA(Pro) deacylase